MLTSWTGKAVARDTKVEFDTKKTELGIKKEELDAHPPE